MYYGETIHGVRYCMQLLQARLTIVVALLLPSSYIPEYRLCAMAPRDDDEDYGDGERTKKRRTNSSGSRRGAAGTVKFKPFSHSRNNTTTDRPQPLSIVNNTSGEWILGAYCNLLSASKRPAIISNTPVTGGTVVMNVSNNRFPAVTGEWRAYRVHHHDASNRQEPTSMYLACACNNNQDAISYLKKIVEVAPPSVCAHSESLLHDHHVFVCIRCSCRYYGR